MENEVTIDEKVFCFSMKNYVFESFSLWMKIFWLFKNSKLNFENFNATFHNLKFHLLTSTLIDSDPFDNPPRELVL